MGVVPREGVKAAVGVDPLFKLNIGGEENTSLDQTILCNELDGFTTERNCTAIFKRTGSPLKPCVRHYETLTSFLLVTLH